MGSFNSQFGHNYYVQKETSSNIFLVTPGNFIMFGYFRVPRVPVDWDGSGKIMTVFSIIYGKVEQKDFGDLPLSLCRGGLLT